MKTSDFSTRRPSTSRISNVVHRVARADGLRRLECRARRRRRTAGAGPPAPARPASRSSSRSSPAASGGGRRWPGCRRSAAGTGRPGEPRSARREAPGPGRPRARWRAGCRPAAGRAGRPPARSARSSRRLGWTALARSTNSRQASTASRSRRPTVGPSLGRPQGGDRQDGLAGHAERLAAGHHDPDGRAGLDERPRQPGAFGQDGVAVVEDQQERACPSRWSTMDARSERPAGSVSADGADDRRQHEGGVREAPAFDDPDPVLEPVEQRAGQPAARPGSSRPRRGRSGSAATTAPASATACSISRSRPMKLVTSIARLLRGASVVRGGGKSRGESRAGDLEEPLRACPSERRRWTPRSSGAHRRRQVVGDELAGRLRDEDLPAVTRGADPRRAVDVEPDVALGRAVHGSPVWRPIRSRMATPVRPGVAGDRELPVDGRLDGRARARGRRSRARRPPTRARSRRGGRTPRGSADGGRPGSPGSGRRGPGAGSWSPRCP